MRGFTSRLNALSFSSALRSGLSLLRTYRAMKSSRTVVTSSWQAGGSILKRVLAAIYALAQFSSFAYRFERGPIRPCPDRVAMFAPAQAVVEDKSTSAGSGDANPKTARRLCALDSGTRKIGDAVAISGPASA